MRSTRHRTSRPSSEHLVRFFDDDESRGAGVAAFVRDGLRAGDAVMMVAKETNRNSIVRELGRLGVDLRACADRLVLLDAHATLDRLVENGRIDASKFTDIIGQAVAALSPRPRVYGEVVDILAEEGNFAAVHQLEALWADLTGRQPLTLLCGYASAHFAAPDAKGLMRGICQVHQGVERDERDLLANWLLETQVSN